MHKFLRAIGFSNIKDKKEPHELITDSIQNADTRSYVTKDSEYITAEFCRDFADGVGLSICGEFDQEDKFTYDYYYPYLKGTNVSSSADITVERHAAEESYAGVCDEIRVGVTLIFYLQNMIPYLKAVNEDKFPIKGTTLTLAALSIKGKIMMPIAKSDEDIQIAKRKTIQRNKLIYKAKNGDESAIEDLTLEDMDMYTTISKKIKYSDVYSLVDSYFMPYGVECDQYSVLGEIVDVKKTKNKITGDNLVIMGISCNEIQFDVCINEKDLLGEPAVGRRFKGNIWMQGQINYPDSI